MEWDLTCPLMVEPKLFCCELCGRPFERQWQLEVHRLTVAGSRWCR